MKIKDYTPNYLCIKAKYCKWCSKKIKKNKGAEYKEGDAFHPKCFKKQEKKLNKENKKWKMN